MLAAAEAGAAAEVEVREPAAVRRQHGLVAAVPRWLVRRPRPGDRLPSAEAPLRDRVPVRRGPQRVPLEQDDPDQVPERQVLGRMAPE